MPWMDLKLKVMSKFLAKSWDLAAWWSSSPNTHVSKNGSSLSITICIDLGKEIILQYQELLALQRITGGMWRIKFLPFRGNLSIVALWQVFQRVSLYIQSGKQKDNSLWLMTRLIQSVIYSGVDQAVLSTVAFSVNSHSSSNPRVINGLITIPFNTMSYEKKPEKIVQLHPKT